MRRFLASPLAGAHPPGGEVYREYRFSLLLASVAVGDPEAEPEDELMPRAWWTAPSRTGAGPWSLWTSKRTASLPQGGRPAGWSCIAPQLTAYSQALEPGAGNTGGGAGAVFLRPRMPGDAVMTSPPLFPAACS